MTKQVKRRRGTAAEHAAFTGAVAELTVDTTNNRVRVHDGVTAGGFEVGIQTGAQIKTLYEAEASAFTDAQFTKLAGVEALADVTDATNVAAALTNGVAALTSGEVTQLANIGTEAISAAEWGYVAAATAAFTSVLETKIDGIEALADVTDATNVTAAGALMDSEVTNLAQVKAFSAADYATAAQGTLATNALPKAGGALTGAVTTTSTFDGRDVSVDGTKLDGIEALADVTDVTNVTAAGALMDSELAGIAAVKALNQGVATTDSPTFAGLTATTADINGGTIDGTVIGGTTAAASTFTNTNLSALASSIEKTAVDVFVYDTSLDSDGGAWRKRTQHTSWYNETLDTPTRGSRKEFPAVAVIVATTTSVTIYDGDDPALPMWMVFNTGTGGFLYTAANAVVMLNGQLEVGMSGAGGGRSTINFVADFGYYQTNNGTEYNLKAVSAGNYATVTATGTVPPIVNRAVNDVAMTVLPNAPIDPATGLPVPTIAVATDGGVSQIGWDGVGTDNVWDVTTTQGASYNYATSVDFDGGDVVFCMDNTASGGESRTGFRKLILTADITVTADGSVMTDKDVANSATGPSLGGNRFNRLGNTFYGTTGLVSLQPDTATPASGMVAYVTTDYATGYMVGDIKGAWLASTDSTDLVGAELVTNGGFATDTSGWTAVNATLSIVSGELVITSTTTSTGTAYQSLTTVVGETYVLSTNLVAASGAPADFLIGTSAGDATHYNGTDGTSALFTAATFVATTTTTFITMRVLATAIGHTSTWDNITCRLADPDRSVNGNGLQVFGTITKTAVA